MVLEGCKSVKTKHADFSSLKSAVLIYKRLSEVFSARNIKGGGEPKHLY